MLFNLEQVIISMINDLGIFFSCSDKLFSKKA